VLSWMKMLDLDLEHVEEAAMIRQTVWSGGNAFAQEYGAIPASRAIA